jgi:hypothetical protein
MSTWLSIATGIVAAFAIIATIIFVAFRPYLQAKAPKSLMADPAEPPKDWSNSNWMPLGHVPSI